MYTTFMHASCLILLYTITFSISMAYTCEHNSAQGGKNTMNIPELAVEASKGCDCVLESAFTDHRCNLYMHSV